MILIASLFKNHLLQNKTISAVFDDSFDK